MSTPAPSLLPLLRSENQLRLLTKLLLESARTFSISELVAETGVPQPSVSREVGNLLEAGLLTAEAERGRRVVRADTTSPIFPELSSLLLKTAGPKVVLERLLSDVPGVERALIYGSWAQRYAGVGRTPPGDIDVLVIGTPSLRRVRVLSDAASEELGRDVNVTVLAPDEWAEVGSGFVAHVKASPVVDLDLNVAAGR